MKEQLLKHINNADREGMFNFLKNLTPKERNTLAPEIRKFDNQYDTWEKRRQPGIAEKLEVSKIAMFICYSSKQAIRELRWNWYLPPLYVLDEILPWFCPDNFDTYSFTNSYPYLMKWKKAGYINSSFRQRILSVFPDIIYKRDNESRKLTYTHELLEQYPEALDEHIWWIFEEPSEIEWNNKKSVINQEATSGKGCWFDTFIKYTTSGRLDCIRLLRECLQTANHNLNKTQTGWFVDLFMVLEPTNDELFLLQDELFATLTCQWSKPVGNTLKLFKKMASDSRFQSDNLLPSLPMLLSSEVKNVLTNTLAVVETILKKECIQQEMICTALPSAFLSKDETIQKKAAALLLNYMQPGEKAQKALAPYTGYRLTSTCTTLKNHLPEEAIYPPASGLLLDTETITSLLTNENKITEPSSVEEFVFSLSRCIDLKEPYFFDLLLNNIAVWGNDITEEKLILLEPIFQKVYKVLYKWDTPPVGGIAHITLANYGSYLMTKFPGKLPKLQKYREKMNAIDTERSAISQYYTKRHISLDQLHMERWFEPYHQIAQAIIERLKKQNTLPLLSTPTHLPAWIDPAVLVDKLAAYQQQNISPIDMDMQLAIMRCALDHPQEALIKVKQQLSGELKDLMLFLLDPATTPPDKMEHPAWWVTAGITRSPDIEFPEFGNFEYKDIPYAYLSGNHSWEAHWQEYLGYGNYNKQMQSYDRIPAIRASVRLLTAEYEYKKRKEPLLIEPLLNCKPSDEIIEYLLLMIPNNTDLLLSDTGISLANWGMWEVREQRIGISTGKILYELRTPFREMHCLAMAALLLGEEKTASNYVVSAWSERVQSHTIDSARLGKAMGIIESLEIKPLKRITDLITNSMLGVSALHNHALLVMVEALLSELSEKPIKNLKKQLEIYNELLALNQMQANIENIPQLKAWENEGNLKQIMKQIIIKSPHS